MSTSESPAPTRAPRPFLLVMLGVAAVGLVVYSMWSSAASPKAPPSNQRREQARSSSQTAAGALSVRLDALKQPPPEPDETPRNPFRFYVKPPPAPPLSQRPPSGPGGQSATPGMQQQPPSAPTVPPIPLKFIGTMEQGSRKVAIFSDGRGLPVYAFEGQLVLGQYKLVKIGVESVVMEYPDGRGRQTIPMRGQ